MNVEYDPDLVKKLKKLDVKIRKRFKERILQFSANHYDPQLNNHLLKDKWKGFSSIDITADWRAIFEVVETKGEKVAYFSTIGTHKDLYK